MTRDYFRRLYDYNAWADAKIWDIVLQLSDEQYTQDLAYSHGSIRDQMTHIISTDHIYFSLLQGAPDILDGDSFPDRASLRAQWDATEALIRSYLGKAYAAEGRIDEADPSPVVRSLPLPA